MILKNIYKRKGRATMVIAALATATALLLSMLSISEAMWRSAKNKIEESIVDAQLSTRGLTYYSGGVWESGAGIKNARPLCRKLNNLSEVRLATPVLEEFSGKVILTANGNATPVYSRGVIPKEAFALLSKREMERYPEYGHGGFLKGGDELYAEWSEEVLVDENLAEALGVINGTQIKLSTLNEQHNFTVVGIFKTELMGGGALKGLYFVVLHLHDLQRLLAKEENDGASVIYLSLTPEVRSSKQKVREFKDYLEEQYPFLVVETKEDLLKKAQQEADISRAYYSMMGVMALIIGLLFVMCVMVMNVHERLQEIGVLRAIGISRKTIFSMIFVEALILVLLGSAVGIVPGYFGSRILGDYFSESLGIATEFTAFTPKLIICSLVWIILFGCLFSLYPAWKSTRIEVIEAMRRK